MLKFRVFSKKDRQAITPTRAAGERSEAKRLLAAGIFYDNGSQYSLLTTLSLIIDLLLKFLEIFLTMSL
jgi:hypothetical protein